MPTYSGIAAKQDELIRKALAGSLFIGDSTAAVVTTLTGSDSSLSALPTGYGDGGHFTDDGIRFGREVEQSEVTSFGSYTPTRRDITSDSESVEVDFQETNKRTISLFTGAAMASLVPNATSGELSITKPDIPSARTYRLLCLSVDGPAEAEVYIARFYPRAKVTDFAEQAYAKGDDAIQWGCTFTAEKDTTAGYSVRYLFGGVGWKALLTKMGMPLA